MKKIIHTSLWIFFFLHFPEAYLKETPKGPADIKIAISDHEMQSKLTVHHSVKERDGELGSFDDSSVHSEFSQGLLQGKLYSSYIITHKPFVTLNWNISWICLTKENCEVIVPIG